LTKKQHIIYHVLYKKGKTSMKPLFSSRRAHLSKRGYHVALVAALFAVALVFGAFSFTPAAHAAPSRMSAPAASCNASGAEMIFQVDQTHGNETRHIQLWYSSVTRCAWAAETNGQPNDEIWVFNQDTGNEAIWFLTGNSGLTAKIDDAGTQSQACMIPHYINGTYTGPAICTGFF
jgi:hypothetical protein